VRDAPPPRSAYGASRFTIGGSTIAAIAFGIVISTPVVALPAAADTGRDGADRSAHLAVASADATWLARQRDAFRTAIRAARRGEQSALAAVDPDYVIYPYLESAWLGAKLDELPAERIEAYLEQHDTLRPARMLRYRWMLRLAKQQRWDDYLAAWTDVSRPDDTLRCHHLSARLASSPADIADIERAALELWTVGRSQPDACDPVFAWLNTRGALDAEHYRRRIRLALGNREYGLATYLSRWVDDAERERVARWRATARDPHSAFARADLEALAIREPDWLYHAFDRLAVAHASDASEHWDSLRQSVELPDATAHAISRRIALSFARDLSPRAAAALDALDRLEPESAAWRARTAMREQDWPALLYALERLPEKEQRSAEWQYWRGRALAGMDRHEEALIALNAAAADRSYHGFLAADRIGAVYAYDHEPASPDPAAQARLAALPGIRRAQELWRVGEHRDASAEWAAATADLSKPDKSEAALLAHSWGWHPSAISTAARASLWDDLDLRFPLPYRDTFEYWASRSGLPLTLALGIARSESLFLEEAVSSAGAIGLMQLMPATGRSVAPQVAVDWRGRQTLFEPDSNIAMGTRYLSEVMERMGQHPALAAAAYNAGEHRVNVWLPAQAPIPADAWIDSVPFTETRRYVRRVLMAQTIYDWRLGNRTATAERRLSAMLPPVPTPHALAAATR
jgi:soluble lytic murein transglycosylase